MSDVDYNYSVVAMLGLPMSGKCKHCREVYINMHC
jgi:hypothetical protein